MLPLRGEIESLFGVASPQVWRGRLQHADIVIAILGAFALAWLADLITGRRGLFATSLVSGVAAVAGWFLVIRVFAIGTMDGWSWVVWSLAASVLALVGFFLFRSKR
ncbi:MAG: transglycosylase [Brevundimonas sp.]|nr:transglycosylase [Brevundimonas sp.]